MKKDLRILAAVAERDLSEIVAYHQPRSPEKAIRIIAEYDRIIDRLSRNPRIARERGHGWRVLAFRQGTYLLYYRELESYWLVAGIFHAVRDPNWIQAQLLIREVTNS